MGVGDLRPAVFLDRDGTLNELVRRPQGLFSPRRREDFRLFAGVGACVRRLKAAGYMVLAATNQPDIARGLMDPGELEAMHAALLAAAPLDGILVCPHDDADACQCRKPLPGMLTQAAAERGLDLARSFMVGDSAKDMGAARAAGVTAVLIDADYNRNVACDFRAQGLESACEFILAQGR